MSLCAPAHVYGRGPSYWDEEAVIAALQGWAEEYGRPPTSRQWQVAGDDHPCTATVRQLFGNWNAALVAADLSARKSPYSRSRRYGDEDILAAIREAFAAGETTEEPFATGRRRPFAAVIRTRFGSWNEAVRAAGLEPILPGYQPELWDAGWLGRKYVTEGLSIGAIASLLSASTATVHRALRRAGVATRPRGRAYR